MSQILDTDLHSSLSANQLLGSAAVGAVTFPSLLALAQTAVFKPLRITVASRLAPIFGVFSVSLASFGASFTAIKACWLIRKSTLEGDEATSEEDLSRRISFSTLELIISTASSVVIFRSLGGRFSSILPSHLFHPGAFARERIPAIRGIKLANTSEKNLIQDIGSRYGCHTCGKKQVSGFVSDHQPPSHLVKNGNSFSSPSLAETGGNKVKMEVEATPNNNSNGGGFTVRQFFYPQCKKCSSLQGGFLNQSENEARAIVAHPLSLRLYHVFIPVPLLVAYLKSRLQEGTISSLAKLATSSGGVLKTISSRSEVTQVAQTTRSEVTQEDKATQTTKQSEAITSSSPNRNTLHTLIQDSDITKLVSNFPLLIVWQRAMQFLTSFKNPGDGFHMMLWVFIIVAAWGTV